MCERPFSNTPPAILMKYTCSASHQERLKGNEKEMRDLVEAIDRMIDLEEDPRYQVRMMDVLDVGDKQTQGGLAAINNQVNLLDRTRKLLQLRKRKNVPTSSFPDAVTRFEGWICQPRLVFSEQETQDALTELLRLGHWLRLLHYQVLAVRRGETLPAGISETLRKRIRMMKVCC